MPSSGGDKPADQHLVMNSYAMGLDIGIDYIIFLVRVSTHDARTYQPHYRIYLTSGQEELVAMSK